MEYFKKTSLFLFGKKLHTLFAILLIHEGITNAVAIWNKFVIYFCDDLSHQL